MEEYEYLEKMDIKDLVKLINDMMDFEEVTKALMVIDSKDSKKALEVGKDIILNDKGDEYLQATVWDVLFFDNKMEMIESVEKRKSVIGRTLLDDIIVDLTDHNVNVSNAFLNKIVNTYLSISLIDRECMRCNYSKFIEVYFN